MRVLFCHDGPLHVDDNNNYYGIAHNDEMFKRYFHIANKISVAIRVKKISQEDAKKLSKITIKPFEVFEVPNILSVENMFKIHKAKEIIKNAVLKSDYIVVRLPSITGFIAIDFAKKYNKPYLTEVVACPWDAYWNHSFKGKLFAPLMYYKTKKRVWNSEYVIYVTNNFLQKRYPSKGIGISCSNVSLKEFDNKVLDRRMEKIKNLKPGGKIIIGTTAAVNVRYKGQQYVIQALGKLKKKGITNYEYQLVGAGDQSYLKSIAQKYDVVDQVKFLGPKRHDEVFKWLDSIDIYVQPSRQEGLPRALIEAMSRGLPAFGAKTGGIPELLQEEFLFSNTRKNIDEICNILINFDKEKMIKQANFNFKVAKRYDRLTIEKRRQEFFKYFKSNVHNKI